jgi:hypothetical protein
LGRHYDSAWAADVDLLSGIAVFERDLILQRTHGPARWAFAAALATSAISISPRPVSASATAAGNRSFQIGGGVAAAAWTMSALLNRPKRRVISTNGKPQQRLVNHVHDLQPKTSF